MLGADIPRDLPSTIDRVRRTRRTAVVSSRNFTGRRNLELLAARAASARNAPAVLDQVGSAPAPTVASRRTRSA